MNYAASKAGILGLTKSLAKEYGNRGVLVNTVAPGFIKSDMTAVLSETIQAKILKDIPLGARACLHAESVVFGMRDLPPPLKASCVCVCYGPFARYRKDGLCRRGGGRGRFPGARPDGRLRLWAIHRRRWRHDLRVVSCWVNTMPLTFRAT